MNSRFMFTSTVSGTLDEFDANAQTRFKNALVGLIGFQYVSSDDITLDISPGSVVVNATVVTSMTQAQAQDKEASIRATPLSELTEVLGVTVESMTVTTDQILVVAPSPSLPFSEANLAASGKDDAPWAAIVAGLVVLAIGVVAAAVIIRKRRIQRGSSTIVKAMPVTTIANPVAAASATSSTAASSVEMDVKQDDPQTPESHI